ncbi:MAG: hypothetical protein WBK55_00960 [Alphaproteobacteria bacterium]
MWETFQSLLSADFKVWFCALFLLTVIFLILLGAIPLLHRYVENLKIGNNEIKFRPYPMPTTQSVEDVVKDVKALIDDHKKGKEKTDSAEYKLLFRSFVKQREDLHSHAASLSLLLVALEQEHVKKNLGEDSEEIIGRMYKDLEYVIFKFLAIKKVIVAFAADEESKKQLQKIEGDRLKMHIYELWKLIPEGRRKYDVQKLKDIDPDLLSS